MEKFTQLTSVAIPLEMDNLDTDQLMPKQFLHGIDKSGLDKGLFYNLRFTSDGKKNPACVFNKPGFEAAQIIVAGPNFGCGSREPRTRRLGADAVRYPRRHRAGVRGNFLFKLL